MKSFRFDVEPSPIRVAPLAGAWIEIDWMIPNRAIAAVAPLAGAWIEIGTPSPSGSVRHVAPLAGAWIEIVTVLCKLHF